VLLSIADPGHRDSIPVATGKTISASSVILQAQVPAFVLSTFIRLVLQNANRFHNRFADGQAKSLQKKQDYAMLFFLTL